MQLPSPDTYVGNDHYKAAAQILIFSSIRIRGGINLELRKRPRGVHHLQVVDGNGARIQVSRRYVFLQKYKFLFGIFHSCLVPIYNV